MCIHISEEMGGSLSLSPTIARLPPGCHVPSDKTTALQCSSLRGINCLSHLCTATLRKMLVLLPHIPG